MRLRYLGIAIAMLSSSLVGRADTIYSNSAAYAAATTGTATTVTFDGIAASNSFVAQTNPFTLSGYNFSFSPTSDAFIIGSNYYGTNYDSGGYLSVDYTSPIDSLTVKFPSASAISFDYGGLLGPAAVGVLLSDGFATSLSTSSSITGTSSLTFAGITTSSAINSITFTLPDAGSYSALDNISTKTAAVTPEPSSLVLLGTGIVGLFGLARRRFRSVQSSPAT